MNFTVAPFDILQSSAEYGWRTGFEFFEHKTEVFGVGKAGHSGYFLNTQGAVDQKIRSVIDA